MLFRNEAELMSCAEVVFTEFDEARVGSLDPLSFRYAVAALFGVLPSKIEIDTILRESAAVEAEGLLKTASSGSSDRSTRISKDIFKSFILRKRFLYSCGDAAWALFDALDVEAKGFIVREDVVRAVRSCADLFPTSAAEELRLLEHFGRMNRDGTGRVLFNDF
jgi:hypothetical protein